MKKALLIIPAFLILASAIAGWIFLKPFEQTAPQIDSPTAPIKYSINPSELISGGPPKDGIPSIDNPKFESVPAANKYLSDDLLGIGVVSGDSQRFYPFQILVWHELVNDTFEGTPILVSYCPLCGTAIVFDRRVNNKTYEFGVSGKLYNSDLVMYDRQTDSYWVQVTGKAIIGELTDSELELYPLFENAKWGDWKKRYPNSEVLSRDTGATRDYNRIPYEGYEDSPSLLFPVNNKDDRLETKDWVSGVVINDIAKAYPHKKMGEVGLVNDTIGSTSILTVKDPQDGIKIFERGSLVFEINENGELQDNKTKSIWDYNGVSTSGTLIGTELTRIPSIPSFWFGWVAFYPETLLFE